VKWLKTRKRWSLVRNRFLLGSSSEAIVKFDRIDGFPQTGCGPGEHCLFDGLWRVCPDWWGFSPH
jgi:hypothetical protein